MKCTISGEELSSERVEALTFLGIPKERWTSVKVAESIVKPKRAVIVSENWDLIIADSVGTEGLTKDVASMV